MQVLHISLTVFPGVIISSTKVVGFFHMHLLRLYLKMPADHSQNSLQGSCTFYTDRHIRTGAFCCIFQKCFMFLLNMHMPSFFSPQSQAKRAYDSTSSQKRFQMEFWNHWSSKNNEEKRTNFILTPSIMPSRFLLP